MTPSATRPLRATPPFAGAICATPGCGTILSAYRPDGETLCAPCRRREGGAEPEPTAEGVDLDKLVAGILLIHDALHPGELVNVSLEVAALGVEADCWSVGRSIRHIARRHGIIARGERGRPGYAVERWERRYQPVLAFGGGIMDRDEESGKYRGRLLPGLLPQPEGRGDVLPGQLSFLGSAGNSAEGTSEPER